MIKNRAIMNAFLNNTCGQKYRYSMSKVRVFMVYAACLYASYAHARGPSLESRELSGWLRLVSFTSSFVLFHLVYLFLSTRPSFCFSLSVLRLFRPLEWERGAESGGRLREMTRSRSETDADCGRDRPSPVSTE